MASISDHDDVLLYGLDGVSVGGTLSRLARSFTDAFQAWAYRRSVYRTRRALEAVSDHTLRDLGLDRSNILSAARAAADREYGIPTPDIRVR